MTIFDFRPYSYWKHIWSLAYAAWDTGIGDSPRTAMEVELLHLINERQRWQIEELEMEKAHWFAYARTVEEVLGDENARLHSALQSLRADYSDLHVASMEVSRLIVALTDANRPISHETDVLRPNTPPDPPTHEIEPFAQPTDDAAPGALRARLHPAMAGFDWKE